MGFEVAESEGWIPPNHPFVHRVFHYKPSILGCFPIFGNIKHRYLRMISGFMWDDLMIFMIKHVGANVGFMRQAMAAADADGNGLISKEEMPDLLKGPLAQLSNEKKHGCLGYIGDYTTQVCGDYNKPLYITRIPFKHPV